MARGLGFVVTFFLIISLLLFIASIGLASKNRDGVDYGGADLQTSSVHAGFSLFGLCMGVLTCLFGLLLTWIRRFMSIYSLLLFLFMVLVTFFFVCGSIGIWSVIVNGRVHGTYPEIWVAELSLEIIGIASLLLATLFIVPQLEFVAGEGEKKR